MQSKLTVLSDLHLRDGSTSENLTSSRALCEFLESKSEHLLVLNGDIIDLWVVDEVERVYEAHPEICEAIESNADFLIRGNHDGALDSFCGLPIRSAISIDDIFICHGHQADIINYGAGAWLGQLIARLVGLGERYLWSDLDVFLGRLFGVGRYGSSKKYEDYANDLISSREGINRVVLGHTHVRHFEEGSSYYNSGCWINGWKDSITLDIGKDPYIQVY